MKKHLIAAAVAATLVAPAFAQNVTISGVIDQAIGTDDTGASSAASRTASLSGVLTTSKFQIGGSEDLGGGLKASFVLADEFTLTSTKQNGAAASGLGSTFDAAYVQLQGGFGTVALGRFGSMARNAGGAGSLAALGNAGLSGSAGSFNTTFTATAGTNTSTRMLGDKSDNVVAYTTPTIAGFSAQYWRAGANSNAGFTATATTTAATGDSVAVAAAYAGGPLKAAVGQITRKISASAESKTSSFGASYDLGMAQVGLAYMTLDENSTATADKHKVTVLNGAMPLANGYTVIAAHHTYKQDNDASGNKATAVMVGVTKALSKRTTAYAVYGSVSNGVNTSYNLGLNDSATATTIGLDPKTAVIGVRHTF